VAAIVGLYAGWSFFWFVCDDAYIAFRYVANHQLGHGYVWNPPPFHPVEGYTSFLWVVWLDACWTVFGVPPPQAAPWLSLGCSYGILAVIIAMAARLPVSPGLARHRLALIALVLLATLTNRTFLAWTSSGLETALFSLLLLSWTYVALWAVRGKRWVLELSGLATLLVLTRPDGLLFVLATGLAWGVRALNRDTRSPIWHLAPFGLSAMHLLWRHALYGQWLPNTYYAKHTGWWPQSGMRYLGSFLLEYAFWIPLLLAGVVAVRAVVRHVRRTEADVSANCAERLITAGLSLTLIAHAAYYTVAVGGDHFEYRVYHHWVPLVFLATPWLLDRLVRVPRRVFVVFAMMIALSWPIPWTHKSLSQDRTTRRETFRLIVPTAPYFPAPLRPYVRQFDALQRWLIMRSVGMRHQEHKVFGIYQRLQYPTRARGERMSDEGLPVLSVGTVGVPGWTLPHVAILDMFGLNDRVIAHNPERREGIRNMAHERQPPLGYAQCLRPNVYVKRRQPIVVERDPPLTPEAVQDCERRFWAQSTSGN
jgi:arabinofuranosyltransferase